MKMYNFFCLKECSDTPNCFEISEQINESSLSRRQIFDSIFQYCLPRINEYFSETSSLINVSISRSFFSPFNMTSKFRQFAFHLDYLKKSYSYLSDMIVLAYVSVEAYGSKFIYVFFAKEVTNE